MTTDRDTLLALAERVERATAMEAEHQDIGVEVNEVLGIASYITEDGDPCLSVDGAIAIVPSGYDYAISREGDAAFAAQVMPNGCDAFDWRTGLSSRARTMSTCLTAAALRARAASLPVDGEVGG
jgi:hypothetical protein